MVRRMSVGVIVINGGRSSCKWLVVCDYLALTVEWGVAVVNIQLVLLLKLRWQSVICRVWHSNTRLPPLYSCADERRYLEIERGIFIGAPGGPMLSHNNKCLLTINFKSLLTSSTELKKYTESMDQVSVSNWFSLNSTVVGVQPVFIISCLTY